MEKNILEIVYWIIVRLMLPDGNGLLGAERMLLRILEYLIQFTGEKFDKRRLRKKMATKLKDLPKNLFINLGN